MKSFYESHKEFDCDTPDECRFREGPMSTTLLYSPPIYNRKGELISTDSNTTSYDVTCDKCGRVWSVSRWHDGAKITRRLDKEK